MQSLLTKTINALTPSSSSGSLFSKVAAGIGTGTYKAQKPEELFPHTTRAADGEECLYDCASCTEQLPRKWEIDETDEIYGYVKGWETHMIVATGKKDWVRDVADEKGSVMETVEREGTNLSNGRLMVSASDWPTGHGHGEGYEDGGRTRVLLLPQWVIADGVTQGDVRWLLNDVVGRGVSNSTRLHGEVVQERRASVAALPKGDEMHVDGANGDTVMQHNDHERDGTDTPDIAGLSMSDAKLQSANSSLPTQIPRDVKITRCRHRAIILMCSHGTRDWRCGKSAPILKREFERHLRPLGLYRDYDDDRPGGVGIYFINHVGGHKYSANVMIYRREGVTPKVRVVEYAYVKGVIGDAKEETLGDEAVQGIWLARVRPEDCENIVRYTILKGKVVKPQRQLRGGFDRERGFLSW